MTNEQLTLAVISFLIPIIGYFIKKTIDDNISTDKKNTENNEKLKEEINILKIDVKVLKVEHNSINEKLGELFDVIKSLSLDIKQLTKELSNKKNRDDK